MKLTGYQLPPTYRLSTHRGAGCAGDPPGHPRYFVRSVYTQYGNSPPSRNGKPAPHYELNGRYYSNLEDVDKLFKPLPLDSERVQLWIADTFRHHHSCYQDPDGAGSWHDNMIIYPVPDYKLKTFHDDERFSEEWREAEKTAIELANTDIQTAARKIAKYDNHDATIIIRRYYPEFKPSARDMATLVNNPPQEKADWWERLAEKPTPETCPGADWQKHPVNGAWCQVCGWHDQTPES